MSLARFAALPAQWSSIDHDPGRIVIPSPPYLFIDAVLEIHKEPARMHYVCKPYENTLIKDNAFIPFGIVIELFQGYIVLADHLKRQMPPKKAHQMTHRVLGGEIIYHTSLTPTNADLDVDVQITKVTQFGKSQIVHYDGQIQHKDKLLIALRHFKAIFFDTQKTDTTKKPDPYMKDYEILTSVYQDQHCADFFKHQRQGICANTPTFHTCAFHKGGRYKQGLIVGVLDLHPDDWFFKCHFYNDPCMPGSLVLQGIFDLLSYHQQKQNKHTLIHPMHNLVIHPAAKAHVLPTHKQLTYYVHYKSIKDNVIIADADVVVDNQLSFTCADVGIQYDI